MHRLLLSHFDICDYSAAHSQSGFDLDLSCILFDGNRANGAFLARRTGDVYYVDRARDAEQYVN